MQISRPTASTLLLLLLGLVLGRAQAWDPAANPSSTPASRESTASIQRLPTLIVLDPVDVGGNRTNPEYGDFLRDKIKEAGKWSPLPRADMERKLAEFGWESSRPCHEFQCGFDAGNVLLAEYVLFGTLTPLEGLSTYTFNILHIPSSQIVASEVGDVARKTGEGGDGPLQAKLAAFIQGLDPGHFDKTPKPSRGLMAVVDLSPGSPESRVMAERVGTHVYASRRYDLMSPLELHELLAAMDISLAAAPLTDANMLALGSRLNVAYLVQSKLTPEPQGNRMELVLFDVAGNRRIRDWPTKPTRDFQDLLHREQRFFTTLKSQPEDRPENPVAAQGAKGRTHADHSVWKRRFLSAVGISASAGLAALAYSAHQDADAAHARAEASYSAESGEAFKQEVQDKDMQSVVYGSLAALSLGASVTLWTF